MYVCMYVCMFFFLELLSWAVWPGQAWRCASGGGSGVFSEGLVPDCMVLEVVYFKSGVLFLSGYVIRLAGCHGQC